MEKQRLEAFSDGVIAIIITVMVLEFKEPAGASWSDLRPLLPVLSSYLLSFVFLGIYWVNHHHLFQAARFVNGRILWANLLLLFWLSLTPFVTAWMGATHFAQGPVALYGVVLLLAAISYYVLARSLVGLHGRESAIATAIGEDRKGKISLALYLAAVLVSFKAAWFSCLLYVVVAVMWLIPDPRIEKVLSERHK